MAPLGVIMRPVHDPTLFIPFVLAQYGHPLARRQSLQVGRHVQIMCNQQADTLRCPDNESLMRRSVAIIGQNALNHAVHRDDLTAGATFKGRASRIFELLRRRTSLYPGCFGGAVVDKPTRPQRGEHCGSHTRHRLFQPHFPDRPEQGSDAFTTGTAPFHKGPMKHGTSHWFARYVSHILQRLFRSGRGILLGSFPRSDW